jgi:hypothetical protein
MAVILFYLPIQLHSDCLCNGQAKIDSITIVPHHCLVTLRVCV